MEIPAGIYLLKVNNRNTRTRCEICSNLTLKKPERRHWCRSGVFTVNFEYISHLVLVFLFVTLNREFLTGIYFKPKLHGNREREVTSQEVNSKAIG